MRGRRALDPSVDLLGSTHAFLLFTHPHCFSWQSFDLFHAKQYLPFFLFFFKFIFENLEKEEMIRAYVGGDPTEL